TIRVVATLSVAPGTHPQCLSAQRGGKPTGQTFRITDRGTLQHDQSDRLYEVAPVRFAQPTPVGNTTRDPADLAEQPPPRLVVVTSHTGQRCSELRHRLRPTHECVTNRTRLRRHIATHGSARNTPARESEYCYPRSSGGTTRPNRDVAAPASHPPSRHR